PRPGRLLRRGGRRHHGRGPRREQPGRGGRGRGLRQRHVHGRGPRAVGPPDPQGQRRHLRHRGRKPGGGDGRTRDRGRCTRGVHHPGTHRPLHHTRGRREVAGRAPGRCSVTDLRNTHPSSHLWSTHE